MLEPEGAAGPKVAVISPDQPGWLDFYFNQSIIQPDFHAHLAHVPLGRNISLGGRHAT